MSAPSQSSEQSSSDLLTKDACVQLLSGAGIEIGALHRPTIAPHLQVTYVDRISTEDMCAKHPELEAENPPRVEIVDDGAVLSRVADRSQDFVIASHLIEHLKDPIAGMLNWQRVLKSGGRLFLVVPDKEQTFDEPREITTNEHLQLDHDEPSVERDFEHFRDFGLHVSIRQYQAVEEERAEEYAQYLVDIDYDIHFHVWDLPAFEGFLGMLEQREDYELRVVGRTGVIEGEFGFVLERIG